MKITHDLINRPAYSISEVSLMLGISSTTIKRRIAEGLLKVLKRNHPKEKILSIIAMYLKCMKKLVVDQQNH